MTSSAVVLVGAAVYLLLLLGVGLWASTNVRDSADFVVAGRRLPLSLCTFTLFATWFGAGTCIGAAGAAYDGGLLAVIADPFGAGLCLILAGLFYVRILRRMRLVTVPDFFARRFGPASEIVSALCVIPAYVGWVAAQFIAFGLVLHQLTGMSQDLATVLGAAIVLLYTVSGGMWAVTLTDFVQGIVVIAGLFVLLPIVLPEVGGVSGLVERSPPGTFRLTPEGGLREWFWYLQAWLVIGIGNIPGQDLLQRALSSKNEAVAQWSAYLAAGMYFTVGMVPVLLGIAGALVLPGLENSELVLIELGRAYLHPVALAVFVGALFSALMSSADSGLLAPASILGENVATRIRPGLDGASMLRAVRWSVVGIGTLALLTGLYLDRVYDVMVNSWSVILVSLFVPLTAGLYWRRANGPGAIAAMGVGLSAWLVLTLLQDAYPADVLATLAALIALVAVSLATSERHPPRPLTDAAGEALAASDRLGLLPLSRMNET